MTIHLISQVPKEDLESILNSKQLHTVSVVIGFCLTDRSLLKRVRFLQTAPNKFREDHRIYLGHRLLILRVLPFSLGTERTHLFDV